MPCDPCFDDGISRPAMIYCVKCEEFHCKTCFESHHQFRATKHHNIVQGSHMPASCADKPVRYCFMSVKLKTNIGVSCHKLMC